MKLIYCILLLVLAAPSNAAYWGVAAEFADWSPAQSEYEAPILAQRGVGCVFLNMHGYQRNWPNWVRVNDAWRAAKVSTIWDLPVCIPECERIYGMLPGVMEIDDRAVLQSGARVYFAEKPRLGNIFLPALSEHAQRVAQTMAMRLERPAGCRITANAQFYHGSHDEHALASWRAFLKRFFGDDSPGRDTNGDTATLNSAFGASYTSWDQVPRAPSASGRVAVGPLRDIWLASSYADFVERLSAPMWPLVSGGPVGPGVAGVQTPTVDASLLAAQKHVKSIYTDRWKSIPALESVASTFGKKLIACPAPIGAVDFESSLQDVLKALPYVEGMIFDYKGLTKRATTLNEDPVGPPAKPVEPTMDDEGNVVAPLPVDGPPAEIKEFSRGFRIIPMLAPFAGRLRVERAPVLWITSRGLEEKDLERIRDASCVTEATLALYPDSVDLSRFKAVIYASASPCISTTILQRLFEYALKGGVVFIDAWNVASGPTLHGREQSGFWWELMKPTRSEFGKGETTISYAGDKWSMKGAMPYLVAGNDSVQASGAVVDSTGATYPLVLVRKMGKTGKWVLINVPGAWREHPDLLRAIVREESGVDLPDSSKARVYTGEGCALAVGGTERPVAIPCAYPEAVAFDVTTHEAETGKPVEGLLRLSKKLNAGEARLWVVKPYGKPVVLYTDGGLDHAASISDGEYRDGVLRFTFAERAFVSSPDRPTALIIDGKPAPFNYDPEHHIVGITRAGGAVEARLEYTKQMAKTFKINDINDADLILLLNLQGVVNRDGARLFLDAEGRSDWGPSDRRWMSIYSQKKSMQFDPVETFDGLVEAFRDHFRGLVVYDPAIDASRYVALTIAGLEDLLAVSPNQIKGRIAELPVKHDLRGRFKNGVETYEWALKELRPRCSGEIAYSAGQSHDDVNLGHDNGIILALDYAIAHRGFVFNLSPCPEPAKYDFDKEEVKGHPEDVRLMDAIFATYKAPAKIYGWNEPEWKFTSRISKHGHMLMCGRGANLSFHQHVPADRQTFKQVAETDPKPRDIADKYYLAFMTNEGDTPRVFTTFFFGGWEDPERGSVPINWGISPTLVSEFPAIAEYYYSTATKNDYFYAGVSGPGYAFIDQLPDVRVFARYGRRGFQAADIDIVDAWDEFEFHPELYEKFVEETGVKLFTLLPRGEAGPRLLPSGVPVIVPHEKVHYKGSEMDSRVEAINAIAAEHKPPFLVPLYGGVSKHCCSRYAELAKRLDPAKFEFVTLADMAWMAKKLASK